MNFLSSKTCRWIALALRVALGANFMYAAYMKLQESWTLFAIDIEAYGILPHYGDGPWLELLARTLPWIEMALGVWLITGIWLRASATLSAAMMVGFMGAITWALVKHLDINCGCYGPGEKISWLTNARDGSVLVASLALAAWSYLRDETRSRNGLMNFLRSKTCRWIALALRVALGANFMFAAYMKLQDSWLLFAMDIDAYGILPHHGPWLELLARTLPWIEMALGVWLITGIWLRASATLSAAMMVWFMGVITWALVKHLNINCGCYGPGEPISWLTNVRDGSVLVGSLALAAWSYLRGRTAPPAAPVNIEA